MKHIRNIKHNSIFIILSVVSIALITIGFFTPPMFVIDGSVLEAVGLLIAFAALDSLNRAIEGGKTGKFKHGSTEIEIVNDDDKQG